MAAISIISFDGTGPRLAVAKIFSYLCGKLPAVKKRQKRKKEKKLPAVRRGFATNGWRPEGQATDTKLITWGEEQLKDVLQSWLAVAIHSRLRVRLSLFL